MAIKILIVEDNLDLSEAYSIMFNKAGFVVKSVNDGKEAQDALKTFNPDIILLDIMMPYMNGFKFLSDLRASGNKVKVIVNSNLSQEGDINKSFQLGANEYLRKSDYTASKLVEKVKELMRK